MKATAVQDWPDEIRESIVERVGSNPDVRPLGGMGGAAVARVTGRGRSVVLKRGRNPVETYVYTAMSERLRANGVGMPELYAAFKNDGTYWLLLEDIPHSLPRQRWDADREQLAILCRLHALTTDEAPLHADAYRPEWPAEMTADTLSLFAADDAAALAGELATVRRSASDLFEPHCLISGDPNPANWGMRDDGALVLYDWERCTVGAPAIDLAITVPGLGDWTIYKNVAEVYLQSETADVTRLLASEIGWAKVWSVTEFLAQYARGEVTPVFHVERLVAEYPAWVKSVARGSD